MYKQPDGLRYQTSYHGGPWSAPHEFTDLMAKEWRSTHDLRSLTRQGCEALIYKWNKAHPGFEYRLTEPTQYPQNVVQCPHCGHPVPTPHPKG